MAATADAILRECTGTELAGPDAYREGQAVAIKTLEIDGMSCGHCVKAVTMALQDLPGVDVKDVTVGRATIEVDEHAAPLTLIAGAIEDAGFVLRPSASDDRPSRT